VNALTPTASAYMLDTPMAPDATLARQCGYTGNSPALLGAYEQIKQAGIRQARAAHFDRKRIVDEMKAEPAMFFAAIRPNLCTEEAIDTARRVIFRFRNLETWRQEMRVNELRRAKEMMVLARFFRRYGRRAWAIQVAA
jgi:hypothetical protein